MRVSPKDTTRRLAPLDPETFERVRKMIALGYSSRSITLEAPATLRQVNAVFALVVRDVTLEFHGRKTRSEVFTDMVRKCLIAQGRCDFIAPDEDDIIGWAMTNGTSCLDTAETIMRHRTLDDADAR